MSAVSNEVRPSSHQRKILRPEGRSVSKTNSVLSNYQGSTCAGVSVLKEQVGLEPTAANV